ncbi:MAG: ADP-forming succinate--CoA ligase subunit beta [Bacillota bacterium]|nr:MAG: ADP-forming succinate--CoA ligase subunit beta [Bacillota bacterium]
MKLYEYLAKEAFARHGIPVPPGRVATSPKGAAEAAQELGDVALKVQILAGGRGKAGGIRFASTPDEAARQAAELLGTEIRGLRVSKVLVEKKLQIDREFYLGVAVDGGARRPVVIASTAGGVNIEDVPEKLIIKQAVDPAWGLMPFRARQIARRLDLGPDLSSQFTDILLRLYDVFQTYDAELAEINPLALQKDGLLVAADGRLNMDDDALFRHPDSPVVEEGTELELRARKAGLAYVELDGDIAVMANGAGITMATLDIIQLYGGRPANFLDAGGGAGVETTAAAIELLLSRRPKALLINIFGGITRCDDVARALVTVGERRGGFDLPVVIRLVGTNEKEGLAILEDYGLKAYRTMDEAAAQVVHAAKVSAGDQPPPRAPAGAGPAGDPSAVERGGGL